MTCWQVVPMSRWSRWASEGIVAAALELDEFVEHFTLVGDELELLRNKAGATRLAFALFLKYLP